MNRKGLSRRDFLRFTGLASVGLIAAACAPSASPTSAPAPTEKPAGQATEAPATAAPAGPKVAIEVWHGFTAQDADTFVRLVGQYFTPNHPNIEVKCTPDSYEDKLLPAISGGNPPDASFGSVYDAILLWGVQGALVDLQPLVDKDKMDLGIFVPAGLEPLQYKGKTYGLPFVNYNVGFYWNKTLFKEANLDPERPPKDWTELVDYAKKLTKKDSSGNITQLGWMPVRDHYTLAELALANGGHMFDKANNLITANDPKVVAAMEWDYNLAKEAGTDQVNAFRTSFVSGDNPFLLGKVAMSIEGDWYVAWSKKTAPDLNFGTASVPASDPQYYPSNVVWFNSSVMPAGAKHPDEAWAFLKWLVTDEQLSKEFALSVGNLPQLKSAIQGWSPDPKLQVFLDNSNCKNATAWAPTPAAGTYAKEADNAISTVYAGQSAPKDALDSAQTIVAAEHEKYR